MASEEDKYPKMRAKLGVLDELKFKLSIKGETSDPESVTPKARFMVTEVKTGISVCLPMVMESGVATVVIPTLPGVLKENTDYIGSVEVIVGKLWFNPTTIRLVFESDIEVESMPIFSEKPELQGTLLKEEEEVIEDFSDIIKPSARPVKSKPAILPTEFESSLLKGVLFTENTPRSQPQPVKAKPAEQKKILPNPNQEKMKKSLKSMISDAWNELEE